MPLRPCPDCHTLSTGTRCVPCEGRRQRAKRTRRPYTSGERSRRAAVVGAWVALHGHVCPGWKTAAHPSRDLTADHPTEVASGGSEGQDLQVLCRSCNSRKALTRANAGAGGRHVSAGQPGGP